MKFAALVLLGFLALAAPDSAQSRVSLAPINPGDEFIRVQVGTSFFVAGPTDDSDAANKLREDARRTIYAMAGHECDVLKATIAGDCRLDGIFVNINRQHGFQQKDGFTINGNMSFRIIPK